METITIEVKFKLPVVSKDEFMKLIKKSDLINIDGVILDGFTIKDNSKENQKIKIYEK